MSSGDQGLDIDFILSNIVGGGGRWQWVIVFAMWPITFAAGYPLLLHMFTAFAPRHRCFIPGCDKSNDTINDLDASYQSFALPKEYSSSEIFLTEHFDPCHMFHRKNTDQGQFCTVNFPEFSQIFFLPKFVKLLIPALSAPL